MFILFSLLSRYLETALGDLHAIHTHQSLMAFCSAALRNCECGREAAAFSSEARST